MAVCLDCRMPLSKEPKAWRYARSGSGRRRDERPGARAPFTFRSVCLRVAMASGARPSLVSPLEDDASGQRRKTQAGRKPERAPPPCNAVRKDYFIESKSPPESTAAPFGWWGTETTAVPEQLAPAGSIAVKATRYTGPSPVPLRSARSSTWLAVAPAWRPVPSRRHPRRSPARPGSCL